MTEIKGINNHMVKGFPSKIQAQDIEGTFYNPEQLAGNVLRVDQSSQGRFELLSVPAGSYSQGLARANFGKDSVPSQITSSWSLYIDNDADENYLYPGGASLTSADLPIIDWHLDEVRSDIKTGEYFYTLTIRNISDVISGGAGSTHSYYFYTRTFFPIANKLHPNE